MSGDTIFFYVDGSDLDDIAPMLRTRFRDFLRGRNFIGEVWFVDQRDESVEGLAPGDLRAWELGLNLSVDASPEARPAAWFDDVRAIVAFLQALSAETGREFAVGVALSGSSHAEDLFCVGAGPVDLDMMKAHLGG